MPHYLQHFKNYSFPSSCLNSSVICTSKSAFADFCYEIIEIIKIYCKLWFGQICIRFNSLTRWNFHFGKTEPIFLTLNICFGIFIQNFSVKCCCKSSSTPLVRLLERLNHRWRWQLKPFKCAQLWFFFGLNWNKIESSSWIHIIIYWHFFGCGLKHTFNCFVLFLIFFYNISSNK